MSNPKYQTDEFKALQKKWYEKLKKKGFEDIEQDEDHLKSWSSHFFNSNFNETTFTAKEEYYRMARQFLHDYKFKNRTEKYIWSLHSEGVSVRDIAKALKDRAVSYQKTVVNDIVQRLASDMKNHFGRKKDE